MLHTTLRPSGASLGVISPLPHSATQYLYAIIKSDDALAFDAVGIDGNDAVVTINAAGLAAVVSTTERTSFAGLERAAAVTALTEHQRVVERVMAEQPVVPVKFGTLLPSVAAVAALLERHAAVLHAALAQIGNRVQYEVIALWEPAQLFGMLANEPAVARARQVAQADPTDEARAAVGMLVKAALDRKRTAVVQAAQPLLGGLGAELRINPLLSDAMALNVALLIEPDSAAFDAALEDLDTALATATGVPMTVRCVGPVAPYSFATLNAEVADVHAVSAALACLGLPHVTDIDAVRRVYRAQAALAHPDRNPAADAAAQLDALSAAHRVLHRIADAADGTVVATAEWLAAHPVVKVG